MCRTAASGGVVTLIHVAETREKARENVRFGLDAFRDYFSDVGTFPIVPADIKDPYAFLVESGAGCIGTPDDAIAYIENLLKGSGGFGAIMELAHNWADWEATKRHYELMARFVHPHFQRSRELRRVSLRVCEGSPRGVLRPVECRGAGGDRSAGGAEAAE